MAFFKSGQCQKKSSNQAKKGSVDVSKVAPFVAVKIQHNSSTKTGQETVMSEPESAEVLWSLDKKAHLEPSNESDEKYCSIDIPRPDAPQHGMHSQRFSKKGLLSLLIFSQGTY